MYDLISVGGISVDLYYKGQSLTHDKDRFTLAIGGKYMTDSFEEKLGGGGCNVAVGVANHGLSVAVFGKVGNNPFKETILKRLGEKKVSSEFCQFEDDYYKISSILLTPQGERTIIHYETPSHLLKEFFLHDDLKKAKNIYFSPLPHLDLKDKVKMIVFLKGDQTNTFVNLSIVDCRKKPEELTEIFDALDVLFVNGHEFSELIKKPYDEIDFSSYRMDKPYLKDRIIIVTDGEKGSHGYFGGKYYFQEAVKPEKIVDTTGCGDAYTAGFIAQYLKSKDVIASMKSGAVYAANKISRLGAN